jgi:kinesin family protein 5
MDGFNGTVLAYGQTGSGKTYTMLGSDFISEDGRGMVPRLVSQLFEMIGDAPEEVEFQVKVSMIEIYREKIRDLFEPSKSNLQIHEDRTKGIFIADVTEEYVTDENEVLKLLTDGNENRSIGVTDMNA